MKRRTFLKGVTASLTAFPLIGYSNMSNGHKASKPKGEVKKRILGKTGIEVSMLGFGSHINKEINKRPDLRDRMIKLGFEGGINTFDVYDHGGNKQFEPMGISLRGIRKEVVISLILATRLNDEMQEEIDGALKSFHTDYIDLYRLYDVTDERIRIMEENRRAGKIRAIGVVSHNAHQLMHYIDRYKDTLDYIMLIYNFHHNMGFPNNKMGYPPNDYTSLIPNCKSLGLGIIGIKPMGSDDMIALAREKGFFKNSGINVAKAMLHYVCKSSEIHCTIPAMNSIKEVMTNLESAYTPKLSLYESKLLADLSAAADKLKGAYLRPHYRWLENWAAHTA